MIWTEAEPRGSRWSNCLVPKDKPSSPTTASSLTFLYSKKIFAEHKEEKKQFFTDVAFMFAWISVLARLWWGGESWMPQILLEDEGTEASGISFQSHHRKWVLMVSVAFPTPSPSWPGCGGCHSFVSLANTLIFFCLYHFELSASCWCHKEAQRGFSGSHGKRGGTEGVPDLTKNGGEEP